MAEPEQPPSEAEHGRVEGDQRSARESLRPDGGGVMARPKPRASAAPPPISPETIERLKGSSRSTSGCVAHEADRIARLAAAATDTRPIDEELDAAGYDCLQADLVRTIETQVARLAKRLHGLAEELSTAQAVTKPEPHHNVIDMMGALQRMIDTRRQAARRGE